MRSQINLSSDQTSFSPSTDRSDHTGLDDSTSTLLISNPACSAAATATSLKSGLQTSTFAPPCSICLLSSATPNACDAEDTTPPAAMMPKNIHGARTCPVDMSTTTSLPGPLAPMPYRWRRVCANCSVWERKRALVTMFVESVASAWSAVSGGVSLKALCSESGCSVRDSLG